MPTTATPPLSGATGLPVAAPPAPDDPWIADLDGHCSLSRESIGGKAWGLNRMRALGLPVPPAFVVTTRACRDYHGSGRQMDDGLWSQVTERVHALEHETGRRFGAALRPLLLSVRSGGAHSMPGMMDTVLNLGFSERVGAALAAEGGDGRHAVDTRRRFEEQYRKVVLRGGPEAIPDDPWAQLRAAVAAVFESWHSPRAQVYRRHNGLSEDGGTAVTIQVMVFGNRDARSGTGVLFSRSPITGDPPAWGEWIAAAQGEDIVAGECTPLPIDALRRSLPEAHAALMRAAAVLEADARDMQDMEFTIESGRLWMLQTRTAKRSPQAALRVAVALADEGLIPRAEALRRLTPQQARQLPQRRLGPAAAREVPIAVGEAACPGVAAGRVVIDPARAESLAQGGEDVILARAVTSPDDIRGVIAARGVITEEGGASCHAAVVSRELGRPCVVGCGTGAVLPLEGRIVTLDGATGRVWLGDVTSDATAATWDADQHRLLEWGLPLIGLQLLGADDTAPDAVDLDAAGAGWRALLAPGITVRGRVLDTDEGIRAAQAAGVRRAMVRDRLPAVLACLVRAEGGNGAGEGRGGAGGGAMSSEQELTLLRLCGLKGRGGIAVLSDALAMPREVADGLFAVLRDRGLCTETGATWRLTSHGNERLLALLVGERSRLDATAVADFYGAFQPFDLELKRIITAWQIRDDGTPNDHLDPHRDQAVIGRLLALHERALPLLQGLGRLSPRLSAYVPRLDRAADRVRAGEAGFVAGVIKDSYHTVWFELHEDLLFLARIDRSTLTA